MGKPLIIQTWAMLHEQGNTDTDMTCCVTQHGFTREVAMLQRTWVLHASKKFDINLNSSHLFKIIN